MRRRLARVPPPFLAAGLVFVMAFALFSFTTQQLTGYEPETAAVTEGLVREGHFWDKEDSPLPVNADILGEGGHHYARTGILQPLLEAPFLAAGIVADNTVGWFTDFSNAYWLTFFYNPFVAALGAVALFALVFLTRRSLQWASAIAALYVFASIAWPYSKIGMETTFMFAIIATFALAVWTRGSASPLRWALTGFATGATVATKPYAALAVLPVAILLWPTFTALDRRQRVRLALAVCLPVLAWVAVICWYNWSRFGSVTDFGYPPTPTTKSMPLGFLGLLFSPGKGLILYSPLVVLGALGLPRLWRQDRHLALALMTFFFGLTALAATTSYWGDEVWGPRYIVPAAWAMLVPIAWWADTPVRRKVLVGVASLAVLVQVVGVSAQYARYTEVVRAVTGVPIYQDRLGVDPEKIPYGNDPTRWIPELSALLIQTEELISSQIVERLGGDGLKITYAPFEGRSRTVDLGDPRYRTPPDFWWYPTTRNPVATRALALAMLSIAVAAAIGLYVVSSGRRRPFGVRAPAPAQ
jgi:hypothetical protein